MKKRFLTPWLATAIFLAVPGLAAAAPNPVQIRLTVDEDPIVPRLAESLGCFKAEGLDVVRVDLLTVSPEDYLLQAPLIKGQIDASYHWFNHAVFGARHNLPVTAVMVFNDAPGMTVLIANRLKGQVRSAADFKGRNVAEGAGYGTKSLLTNYLMTRAGLPLHSFTPVMLEHDGRLEAVIRGLKAGTVDVMTFEEPVVSSLLATGMVTPLIDLNSKEATANALGAAWPAQSLLLAPEFIRRHPDAVQRLVNAFVRTMRFINSHTAEQIIAQLPPQFFAGKDRTAEINFIKRTMPTLAQGDYSFSIASVKLVVDSVQAFDFDSSPEGKWRATAENPRIDPDRLYDNRFVIKAMQEIKGESPDSPAPRAARDSLTVQRARTATVTSRGRRAFYTRRWNLDDLPHYVPEGTVTGTITFWGSNYFSDGNLGRYWAEGFAKYHPGVRLKYDLKTAAAAIPGLLAGVADIGINRKIGWKELLAYQRLFERDPLEIVGVTGSFDVPGWSNALVFVVNKDNPLTQLTMEQLDGILGAERSGGWVGTEWHPEFARGPEKNIRTWGQLGLKGAWADKPIHIYGLNLQYQQATDLSQWVLRGSDKWNESLRMYANYAYADGSLAIGAKMLIHDVGRDVLGIGYGSYSYVTQHTKVIALAPRGGGNPITPSLETVRDRSYPLHDEVYFYLNRVKGKPLDPKLREFMRYVLSREGQEEVQRDAKYLPLTAAVVREQLAKLQ